MRGWIHKQRVRRVRRRVVRRNRSGKMTPTNPNTATAESPRSGRWSCAKIPTARNSGFTDPVSRRKNCPKNGTANSVGRKSDSSPLFLLVLVFILVSD